MASRGRPARAGWAATAPARSPLRPRPTGTAGGAAGRGHAIPTTRPAARNADEVLVLQPTPECQADSEPEPRSVVLQGRDHQADHDGPGQQVERRGRQQVTDGQQPCTGGGRDCCEQLRPAAATEGAREVGGEQHDHADDDGRQRRAGRAASRGEGVGRGRDQRRQRRLVGIAPLRVVAGGDEVQLVAVRSVAAGQGEQHHGAGGRDGVRRCGQPRAARAAERLRRRATGSSPTAPMLAEP